MGQQSSRIYIPSIGDHKDIYFNGKYHDKMYIGSQLVWEKQQGADYYICKLTYCHANGLFYALMGRLPITRKASISYEPTLCTDTVLAEGIPTKDYNGNVTKVSFQKIASITTGDYYADIVFVGAYDSTKLKIIGYKSFVQYDVATSKMDVVTYSTSIQLLANKPVCGVTENEIFIGPYVIGQDGECKLITIKSFSDRFKDILITKSNIDAIMPFGDKYMAIGYYGVKNTKVDMRRVAFLADDLESLSNGDSLELYGNQNVVETILGIGFRFGYPVIVTREQDISSTKANISINTYVFEDNSFEDPQGWFSWGETPKYEYPILPLYNNRLITGNYSSYTFRAVKGLNSSNAGESLIAETDWVDNELGRQRILWNDSVEIDIIALPDGDSVHYAECSVGDVIFGNTKNMYQYGTLPSKVKEISYDYKG